MTDLATQGQTQLSREERLAFALVDANEIIKERDSVILSQKAELTALAPIIESHAALMSSTKTMSITAASKHFDIKPRKWVIPFMRQHDLLDGNELPTDDALRLDLLVLKQAPDPRGGMHSQAMVEVRQLERWRTFLVTRVQSWVQENGL